MKYARIINNVAVDITEDEPSNFYHIDIASEFLMVPDTVQSGWIKKANDEWEAPPAIMETVVEEIGNLTPTPPEFMARLFTFSERVAIRERRKTDAAVDDFLLLVEDPRLTHIDLTLRSTQDAIRYLSGSDLSLVTLERAERIIKGLTPE
jgi:hypothetical protein